ncbi:MAG TPA: hypothetical protein VFK02_14115 [Kofleriaceae bacterium]|nr:hypothetical protein [Kofleriaceae bacterium]
MNLELHIEELVLHGFSPADRHRIADAVRAELERRLAGPGTAEQLRHLASGAPIDRLDAGSLHVVEPARPAAIGAQVGGALASALSGGDR